jgi:hypothetical protein
MPRSLNVFFRNSKIFHPILSTLRIINAPILNPSVSAGFPVDASSEEMQKMDEALKALQKLVEKVKQGVRANRQAEIENLPSLNVASSLLSMNVGHLPPGLCI